jgi:tripartite-type tricarboxylate transporter receptor subunit TctC
LAVTSTARAPELPELPTVAETVPGFEASAWYGFAAAKGVPVEIVDKLNAEINTSLADPKVKTRFDALGAAPMIFTPAEFAAFMASETERWGQAVKAAGLKAE